MYLIIGDPFGENGPSFGKWTHIWEKKDQCYGTSNVLVHERGPSYTPGVLMQFILNINGNKMELIHYILQVAK